MNCKLYRERLQDYLDETLEAAEQAQVSAHVAGCDACRRELDELRKLVALVGSLDELPEPMGFLQGVRERIDTPTVWERIRGLLTQPLRPGVSVAIPVIIVAFVGVFVLMTLLPKSSEHTRKAPAPDGKPVDLVMNVDKLKKELQREGDKYDYEDEGEPGGPAGEVQSGYDSTSDGSRTFAKTSPGDTTSGKGDGAEGAEVLGDLGGGTFGRAGTGSITAQVHGEQKAVVEEETTSTEGSAMLESTGEDKDQAKEAADESPTAVRGAGDSATTTTDDVRREETAEVEEENGEHALGAALEGQDSVRRDAKAFEPQEGDEAMDLIILDLRTDLTSAHKIVAEQGGYMLERRDRDVLKSLLFYVPDKNFDKAVEALHLYNDQNRQALEKHRIAERSKAGLQTLHLVIRRFIEGMDAQ
jgi:hypothetical protein